MTPDTYVQLVAGGCLVMAVLAVIVVANASRNQGPVEYRRTLLLVGLASAFAAVGLGVALAGS